MRQQHPPQRTLSRRSIAAAAGFCIAYICLPIICTIFVSPRGGFFFLAAFFLVSVAIAFYAYQAYLGKTRAFLLETQDADESINKISYEINRLYELRPNLQQKLTRYADLRKMVEKINKELSVEYAVTKLITVGFDIIANKKGAVSIYLIDPQEHALKLFAARKEDETEVIKAKKGDIFDQWVLKHAQPLFIEDLTKDFRFDLTKIHTSDERAIGSLIAAPFVSEDKLLGIMRIDNPLPHYFSHDDLALLSVVSDVGTVAIENAQLYAKTEELAIHDGLTGLYTKAYFLQRLHEEFSRMQRELSQGAVMMLDIDHFKAYNDTYGHSSGDIILKNISGLMSEFFADYDALVCRFGGEEFAVFVSGIDAKKSAAIAEQLRIKIHGRTCVIRRKETSVTASIGVCPFSKNIQGAQDWVRMADGCLYEAKQKGRDRVCCI